MVITLGDDHVATIAAAAFQVAPARGVLANGRHDLQEGVADGKQRIFQAEVTHAGIAEGHLHAEHVDER
ncbi:MAG: hypothetical protein R3E84_16680 [Pseudomonadales bacterium]